MAIIFKKQSIIYYRKLIGIIALYDIIQRLLQWDMYYTNNGILKQDDILNSTVLFKEWVPGMFTTGDEYLHPWILCFGISLLIIYIMGGTLFTIFTKIFTWLFLSAVHTRNPFIIHYGDQLLSILFFLNIFLELDDPNRFARQKVSKTKKKRNKKKTSEKTKNQQQYQQFKHGNHLYLIQISCIYISTGIGKLHGDDWLINGNAVYNAYVHAAPYNVRYPIGTMLKSLFMYVNTDYAVFEVVHFYLCQSIVITEMLIGLFLMYVFCLSSIPFFKANAKKNRLFVNYIIKTATWAGIYLNLCMFLTFDFGLTFHLIFLISFVPFYEMKFTLSNNNKDDHDDDTNNNNSNTFQCINKCIKQLFHWWKVLMIYLICLLLFCITFLKLGNGIIFQKINPSLAYQMNESRDVLISISNALNLRSHSWNMYTPDPPIHYGIPKLSIIQIPIEEEGGLESSNGGKKKKKKKKRIIVKLNKYNHDHFFIMLSTHLNDVFIFNHDNNQRRMSSSYNEDIIKKEYKDTVLNGLISYICKQQQNMNDDNNDDETSLSLSTKYEYIIKYNVNVYKHSTIQYAFKMFKKKCEVVAPS